MKIIWCDNLNRETIADRLVADNIKSEKEAHIMCTSLQNTCSKYGHDWYRVVKDDYILSKGMEDLV